MSRLFAGTPFDIPPTCDRCEKLESECQCEPIEPAKEYADPSKQSARVRVDQRKHKRKVTVVAGLSPEKSDLADLLSKLKSACGAGGTIVEDQLELQGDHLQRVKDEMLKIGYRVR
ncbi:translation initiation factor [Stieleria varia]|nr:translation initiation factor [Stieleria varia]